MLKLKCMSDQKMVLTTQSGERIELFWEYQLDGPHGISVWTLFAAPKSVVITREPLVGKERCGRIGGNR